MWLVALKLDSTIINGIHTELRKLDLMDSKGSSNLILP